MKKLFLFILIFVSVNLFSQELIPVSNTDYKWGYTDLDNNLIIDYKYDYASEFKSSVAKVKLNNKYALINNTGKVISDNYDAIFDFNLGIAVVKNSVNYGCVDTTGKVVIEPNFTSTQINAEKHDYILENAVENSDKYIYFGDKVLNTNPEKALEHYQKAFELSPKSIETYTTFAEKMNVLGNDSLAFKYYQKAIELSPQTAETYTTFAEKMKGLGKDSLAFEYYQKAFELSPKTAETYTTFAEKMNVLGKDSLALEYFNTAYNLDSSNVDLCLKIGGVISNTSQTDALKYYRRAMFLDKTIKPDFFTFANGVVSIANKEGKFGLIDSTLNFVTNEWFDWTNFGNVPGAVGKDDKIAFLDKNYKVMTNWYDDANWYAEDMGRVGIKNEEGTTYFGYINIEGQEVIPCVYESAEDFSNGKASVTKDGKTFCIDKTGTTVDCE